MSLLTMDVKMANLLLPIANNSEVCEALAEYAIMQIKHLNEQFHHVDPNNSAEIGKIQGQYMALKALMSIRDEVRLVKGTR